MFIAGHYTATYDPLGPTSGGTSASIGATRDGFHLRETLHDQPINADYAGEVPVDAINQGAEVSVTLDYIEYDLILPALYAHSAAGQGLNNVGQSLVALSGLLTLTPASGTPAYGNSALPYIFDKAIVSSDIDTLLASKLRQGPITFHCYPDPAHSNQAYRRS